MAHMLLSRVRNKIVLISSLVCIWVFSGLGYAQSTLLPGDLITVSINSSANSLELVALIDIEIGTTFSINSSSSLGESVQITLNEKISAGSVFGLSNADPIFYERTGSFEFNTDSDQLTIFQQDEGTRRVLLLAKWGGSLETNSKNSQIQSVPFINLNDAANHQYYLKNGASGTISMIKEMVSNTENWKSSDTSFPPFRTSFRVLEAPVILFDKNTSTIAEGDSIPVDVAIYGHDGSRLTVDMFFSEAFSTADTNDIRSFKKYTYNFTGLIGDAVYQISVPQVNDEYYEGRETAFFELKNLSDGTYGDFVNHAVFIKDDELPNLSIVSLDGQRGIFELQNKEQVPVDISNWRLETESKVFEFAEISSLAPSEIRVISEVDFVIDSIRVEEDSFALTSETYRILDAELREVLVFNDVQDQRKNNEISEIIAEVQTSTEPDFGETISTKLEQRAVQEVDKKTSIISKQPRWKILSKADLTQVNKAIFWDEKLGVFRNTHYSMLDSLKNIVLFSMPDSLERLNEFEMLSDSLVEELPETNELSEWIVTLSGTDRDKNGIINDSEGYNLVQHKGVDSIQVSSLIRELEFNIGQDALYPFVYLIESNAEYLTLSNTDFIYPEQVFWVKADSLFDPVEIELTNSAFQNEYIEESFAEPISNFQLSIQTESGSDSLSFNFYEEVEELPVSINKPAFDLFSPQIDYPITKVGAYFSNQWNSRIEMHSVNESQFIFPMGMIISKNGVVSLALDQWNMEGGWRLFIEDVETFTRTEIFLGTEFTFEYAREAEIVQNNTDDEIYVKSEPFRRYQLVLESPGFEEEIVDEPEQITLNQNYPNPFNPATTISFDIPEAMEVTLSVFNVVGQPIAVLEQGILNAGEHHYEWDASSYPSGMYIYQLEVGNKILTRKMTLVK